MIAALISATLQVECACRVNAATPVTWGAAIDVPDMTAPLFPVPTPVDRMLTPGAVTSGLRLLSPPRGPLDVKLASVWKPGLLIVIFVAVAFAAAARSLPSVAGVVGPRSPKNGIVTSNTSPPGSGLPLILPSNGG